MKPAPSPWIPSRLGALADIVPGYWEKEFADRGRGDLRVLQARDVADGDEVRWSQLERCAQKPGSERALLQPGDLLLAIRASDPRVICVDAPPADVVAGATFAILRVRPAQTDAHFLQWLLGSDGVRARLRSSMRGSTMPFLGLAQLADFEVPVPPLRTQRAIARVDTLRRQLAALGTRHDRALGRLLEAAAHHRPS